MSFNSFNLELWGGLECTMVRIRDSYRNQIVETGHYRRMEDLDAIAALGIKTVRYPVLWETIAPDAPDRCDWRWHDERLGRLRELGIRPIAGLVHHGSGPCYTDLLDPSFPELLARHAERVARRYPWIEWFTPVNEPLTTARFSALYGHWYPHKRDTFSMLQALVIQCRAIVMAMRAIRRVTPQARLIQTEDMGKVFSLPDLRYQADYENERRWLSFDLLCGRIDSSHPWFPVFLKAGIDERQLEFFIEANCTPDVIGINYYLTSERFLDRRGRDYPLHFRFGIDVPYVDVQAVRVPFTEGLTGPEVRLREVWERYGLPVAVTEAHHGSSRDEQVRWLLEVWNASNKLKEEGADIRAVTIWSLFGCVDWNSLLMENKGFYESGVFDARSDPPRRTALAHVVEALAKTGRFDHPLLDGPGWWHREDRFFFHRPAQCQAPAVIVKPKRKLAITGASGTLGQAFSRICGARSLDHALFGRADMDIAHEESVEAALERHRPWAVVNTAGYVRVTEAHREAERCFRENTAGAEILARACAKQGIPFLTFSSDLVFDGQLGRPYVESDVVNPICIYGNSKAAAEQRVMSAWQEALVVRTSAFFGPWDRYNFLHKVLRELVHGRRVEASDELVVSPTYVPDLVNAALDLLLDKASGIWHLANQGVISWHELALRAAREAKVNAAHLFKVNGHQKRFTALSSERGLMLPKLSDAISRFIHENTIGWHRNHWNSERACAT